MNRQLLEIASWRIAAEIFRKYPDRIKIAELHPGGGIYDCLAIIDQKQKETYLHLNRPGSLHVFGRIDHPPEKDFWRDFFEESSSKNIINHLCSLLNLPEVTKLPTSTPTTHIYRFIATFLTHAAFGLNKWQCRSGMCDTSGYSDGVVDEWFHQFPAANERLRDGHDDGFWGHPAYRFWFLLKNELPLICLDSVGFVWVHNDENTYDLNNLYNRNQRRIWSAVTSVAGSLMT